MALLRTFLNFHPEYCKTVWAATYACEEAGTTGDDALLSARAAETPPLPIFDSLSNLVSMVMDGRASNVPLNADGYRWLAHEPPPPPRR